MLRALLFLSLVLATALPANARDAATGAIYITTLPSAAHAWVDGAYVGRSPVLVDALSTGKHTLTLAKTGWESHEIEIVVSAKLPFQFVDFQLQRAARAPRATGKLALHAQTPIEALSVDGAPATLPANGTLDLEPGPHELVIKSARGRIVRHVVVYAETTTNVVLRAGAGGAEDERAVVVAPVSEYLPVTDVIIEGRRIQIRHNGHAVSGSLGEATFRIDGSPMTFDSAATLVGGKLYLPLELYVRIGAVPIRAR